METLRRAKHRDVRVENGFWKEQLDKIHNITVQDVLDKFERDGGEGVMKNYEWVAEGKQGKHVGPPWYDGLICETIRGISDIIAHTYDQRLDETIEGYAKKIAAAQEKDPDGYINTYGTLMCPNNRWGENGGSLLWQHETYNIGCLAEAGIHYYQATGKTLLLNCAVKAVNCMCIVMGPEPRKNIVPAHSLAEEALVKLYSLFKEEPELAEVLKKDYGTKVVAQDYLDLTVFWMDHRGVHSNRASNPRYMGEYAQDHCPVCGQSEAVGHAVRAALMYTGLVAAGIEADKKEYLDASKRIWENVVLTKLHISGGIGAVHQEERFGYQYDLPNDAYLETCAGVALAFWAGEMHRAFGDGEYMDVFERALYNNVLPGLSQDGTRYFYENPLISDGSIERWEWHSCPCCPPMFLKLMGGLPDYIYSYTEDSIYVNLHIGSRFTGKVKGSKVVISQENCGIPWSGENTIKVSVESPSDFALWVRVPEWSGQVKFSVNGEAVSLDMKNGYAVINRQWYDGDAVQVIMELPAVRMEAHPYVKADTGRVALQRGPLLYCVEAVDNNGKADLFLGESALQAEKSDLFGESVLIKGALAQGGEFTAVPYFLWNNRGKGEMAVWLRQKGKAQPENDLENIGNSSFNISTSLELPDMTGWEGKLYRVMPERK